MKQWGEHHIDYEHITKYEIGVGEPAWSKQHAMLKINGYLWNIRGE